jgi:proteasome lid subunit RPN8/RPN11
MPAASSAEPIVMEASHVEAIAAHAREGMPDEVCGMLGGVGRSVREVFRARNAAVNPAGSYLMHPEDQIRLFMTLEQRGYDCVAFYHSHPPGAASAPSPTDIQMAYYPGVFHVIAVPDRDGKQVSIRAFEIDAGRVSEVPIDVR